MSLQYRMHPSVDVDQRAFLQDRYPTMDWEPVDGHGLRANNRAVHGRRKRQCTPTSTPSSILLSSLRSIPVDCSSSSGIRPVTPTDTQPTAVHVRCVRK